MSGITGRSPSLQALMSEHIPIVSHRVSLALLVTGVGCGSGEPPGMPACEALADPASREVCRAELLSRISDDPEAMTAAIASCTDLATRDLLRLELVADDPERSLELCEQMEGEQAKSWCTSLEGRSHLWKHGSAHGEPPQAPPDGEAAIFGTLDRAVELALADDRPEAERRCEALEQQNWRRECFYRLAEAMAHRSLPLDAYEICGHTGGSQRLCLTHVAWIASEQLVEARPDDPAAQAAVDAAVVSLPPPPEGIPERSWRVEPNIRAAAWHGIYAGSGSASPTAAQGARAEDAAHARGAFAWELVRLYDPQLGIETLADTAWWTWQGTLPPPRGSILAQGCWPARVLPRSNNDGNPGVPTVKHFLNGKRTFTDDAKADLLIAVVEAAWSQGAELSAQEIRLLLEHPDIAVRRTAAKHAGLLPVGFPEPIDLVEDDAYARALAVSTRAALIAGQRPRGIEYPPSRACQP